MKFSGLNTDAEFQEWEKYYLPPASVPKHALILDVGARDGDSALFYVNHGYTNLRLIEPNPEYWPNLLANAEELRLRADIEVRQKRFTLDDLDGVAFVKMDCEGCEQEYDYKNFGIPYAVETHETSKPSSAGIYNYVQRIGYERSDDKGIDMMPTNVKRMNPPLICFFPSHDGRTLTGTTLALTQVARILDRDLMTFPGREMGQAVAINSMVQSFRYAFFNEQGRQMKLQGIYRALWIEDDILISAAQAREIAEMIVKADENHWNIVAPYSAGLVETTPCPTCGQNTDDNWTYYHFPDKETGEIGRRFTLEEIQALKPYDPIDGLGGLGFYYGDVNTDYVWHEGDCKGQDRDGMPAYSGIDWNYYLENNIVLRHYPIVIYHDKSRFYSNERALKYKGVTQDKEIVSGMLQK